MFEVLTIIFLVGICPFCYFLGWISGRKQGWENRKRAEYIKKYGGNFNG